jgi:glycosyltransferase involved in cell wall biosynthesis
MFALIHQNYKIISLYKNDQKEIRNLKTNEVKSKLKNVYNFINYKKFINDCLKMKKYNKINGFYNNNPYLSICIPVFNMEKYISKALLSIINQSFKNYEIIIVNDNSKDDTEQIIKNFQSQDSRIKLLQNYRNLGVYYSRKYAVLNSNANFILFVDPDDMLLNPDLFGELYAYNLKHNLDMIEFSVFHKKEERKKIYYSYFHEFNHYHNYEEQIIHQPKLSNILFYIPNTKYYSSIICRTVWNKIIRKKTLFQTIGYVDGFVNNPFLLTTDDTQMNILNFNYAHNFSNLKLPGYLYNIRKKSMSRINIGSRHDLIVSYNYLLYYNLFYRYLKDYKKDLNFLFYDLKSNYFFISKFKDLNDSYYIKKTILFLNKIIKENISLDFKNFIINVYCKYLIR